MAYLSPEQSGRMNRSVDFRSDFYSLSVTLYQLLTGQLPFAAKDNLQLIYQHMAIAPLPPESINDAIPQALSKTTLKPLAKMPEDRYQSSYAIIHDLDRFLALASAERADADFEVALDDISEQLNISERLLEREISERLMERETHLVALQNGLDQAASG